MQGGSIHVWVSYPCSSRTWCISTITALRRRISCEVPRAPHSACMPGWDRHGELWHGARLEGNEFVGSAQWEGQEGWGQGTVLELEVDFNHGTLTAFKEKEGEMEELGLLAEGLGAHGELCWAVSVQGLGDVVSIARC